VVLVFAAELSHAPEALDVARQAQAVGIEVRVISGEGRLFEEPAPEPVPLMERKGPFTVEEAAEIIRAAGGNCGIAGPNDPIYQTKPRLRIWLPAVATQLPPEQRPAPLGDAPEPKE